MQDIARIGSLTLVAAALAVGVANPLAQAKRKPRSVKVTGQIVYPWRGCAGQSPSAVKPLPFAQLQLSHNGMIKTITLGPSGKFSVTLPGAGKVNADLILDGPLIDVQPQGAHGQPYRFILGRIRTGRAIKITLKDPKLAGAANIFNVLNSAARLAAAASPVRLHKVHAAWRYGADLLGQTGEDLGNSFYDLSENTIFVDGHGDRRDEWEPWVLTHEYGHALQDQVAPVSLEGDHQHSLSSVYPNLPALPYVEGFATAFAATATANPSLSLLCGKGMRTNLAAVPATPALSVADSRFAQFNETTSASAMWRVIKQYGLKRFLRALRDYRAYAGEYPQEMRHVREAMVELENGSAAQHVAIDGIFAAQNLRWGTFFSFASEPALDGPPNAGDTAYELRLTLDGPYGKCETMAHAGEYGTDPMWYPEFPFAPPRPALTGYETNQNNWDSLAPGALGYTWQDECLMETADGTIDPSNPFLTAGPTANSDVTAHSAAGPQAELLFPYLEHADQRKPPGLYELRAKLVCVETTQGSSPGEDDNEPLADQESCQPSHFSVEVLEGLIKGNDDKLIINHYLPGIWNDNGKANDWSAKIVVLQPGADTLVATWTADGYCNVPLLSYNCSIAMFAASGSDTPY